MSQPALKPDATSSRIASRFAALRQGGQKAFITFIAAGDPDLATSEQILAGLSKAGADIIELSIPFSDPMADGPTIQAANIRAFKAGITLLKVLEMVGRFRKADSTTPLVLMGYYNPIYIYGVDKFLKDAKASGVDGLIVVDLPPEEDTELCDPAKAVGLDFIRLVTPTTDTKRLPVVLKNASGFLYYVSMAGVTGTKAIDANAVTEAVSTLKNASALPVAVGFGITTPDEARAISAVADGVIVGSAIVKTIASNLDQYGAATPNLVGDVLSFVSDLAKAIHNG